MEPSSSSIKENIRVSEKTIEGKYSSIIKHFCIVRKEIEFDQFDGMCRPIS